MCSQSDDPTTYDAPFPQVPADGRPDNGWAYATTSGTPLMGPCRRKPGCVYASKPGGGDHEGACRVQLEVHTHSAITAPTRGTIVHSHGNLYAAHKGYGPAVVTIDKQDWLRQTGLRGGGTKRYTTRPIGPQL